MRKSVRKSFDCVETMREVRDRIGEEIAGMNHAELRGGSALVATPIPFFNGWRVAATGIQ